MNAIIKRVWRQDKMVNVDVLNGFVFTGESDAHQFVISGKNGDVPVVITGSITANFKNAKGEIVPLTGAVEDGEAVVTLTNSCYAVEGPFSLTIFADTICIYAAIANVINSSGEVIAYPTASIPSIQELIEEVQDVIASIPQDYSTLNQSVQDLKSAYGINTKSKSRFEDTFAVDLSRGNFMRDAYNPNTGVAITYKYRITSRSEIVFPYAVTLTPANGFRIYPWLYINDTWVAQGWKTGTYSVPANTGFYLQIGRTTDDTSETADIYEFLSAVSIAGNPEVITKDYADTTYATAASVSVNTEDIAETDANIAEIMESGVYKPTIQQGHWYYAFPSPNDDNRLMSNKLYPVKAGTKIIFFSKTLQAYCAVVGSRTENRSWLENSGWLYPNTSLIESVYTIQNDGYLAINIKNTAGTAISLADMDGYLYIVPDGNVYDIPEKAVHVYQFGGAGNDWCFVRTPLGYDPKRAKPYPFVICNHGNGWAMDGTIQKANWTKRTMYVPLDDPDYIADPTEYNGTDDSSLWYSNPTIEALLTAGYVVCGCENYGDALYGNNNCRNACADFFNHMVQSYNVEKRCYMIGASNGAMTSLNAAYLLQGKVKAMILQYPLTCLVNQYQHYSNHQAGIRAAYGITNADITIEELTKAVATHDPLTVDVVDSKKVGVFPPTKLYYSPNDAVVNYQYNTIALATMLDNSNKVVDTVECSGEHGDHSHFAPSDYVAWFAAN